MHNNSPIIPLEQKSAYPLCPTPFLASASSTSQLFEKKLKRVSGSSEYFRVGSTLEFRMNGMNPTAATISSHRRFFTIVLGSVGYACLLGIALDLITANVAVAYFSVHHPRIVATENPWVLALVWGVAASWWFGLLGGIVVATVNQCRSDPLDPWRIMVWVGRACVVMWIVMILILVVTLSFAYFMVPLDRRPANFEHDARLIAVAMAHQFEYLLGGISVIVIGLMTWRARQEIEVGKT